MRNFPFFTTENGVASLTLAEIPYTARAYIRLQATENPHALLSECVSFCRSAGAQQVYATGHAILESYALHTCVYQMSCPGEDLAAMDACLFPVTEGTLQKWQQIYNRRMKDIPNSAWLTDAGARQLLADGQGYFVHKDGRLLGIGQIQEDKILAVASLVPGGGEAVVRTLASAMPFDTIYLEVASANAKAISLYERLGFVCNQEISRWYKIM